MSEPANPERLRRSWDANAAAWTAAVRSGEIESRRLATDAAIVSAVLAHTPRRVLDVGCGEGWLSRALAAHGVSVVGIDSSEALIEAAREAGGTFYVSSYDALAARPERVGTGYDAVVCNFALLEEDLRPLLTALRRLLQPGGVLLIQTLHPWTARGEAPYRNAWRTETFAAFGSRFTEPMPWYFRTLASWFVLLKEAGFTVDGLQEPSHPEQGVPVSVLFTCRAAKDARA